MGRGVLFVAHMLVLALIVGCTRQQLGLPRISLEVASPDGTMSALVKNHATIDPPDQSLWLRLRDGTEKHLRRLAADQDWCNVVVWSGDGSRVGFLVQDARLIVYEAETAEVAADVWLVAQDGYPPVYRVWEPVLSEDGAEVVFRSCRRRGGDCTGRAARLDRLAGNS